MFRKIAFKYCLLRNGAFYALLKADMSKTPTIRMDDSGEIKTSFSGTFSPEAVDVDGNMMAIDWLTDEIQPVMVIDGVDYPLGVFMTAKPKLTQKMNTSRVDVQCFDRGWRVRDTRSATLLYWPSGTLYLDAIKQLLAAAGIKTVFSTPTDATFSEAREDWKIGESYLTVINDLLREINYKPLWFDATGAAVLEPVSVPTAGNIKQIFDSKDPATMVTPELSRESDYYEAPNVFIVCCANPDKNGNMVAVAKNENPQSPLSVQRRGREIVSVQNVNNIASQTALQAHADWLRNKSLMTGEKLTITTGLRHGFGVAETVGVVYDDLTAIGLEHKYSMELQVGGRMTHTIERVIYNLE